MGATEKRLAPAGSVVSGLMGVSEVSGKGRLYVGTYRVFGALMIRFWLDRTTAA